MKSLEYVKTIFQDEASLLRMVEINGVLLEIWQEVNAMPPQRMSLLLGADGNVVLAIKNDEDLIDAIKKLDIKEKNVQEFLEIFKYIALHRRKIIDKIKYQYQEKILNIWHEPKIIENDLVFFVDNGAEGKLEKFTIENLKITKIETCAETVGISLL